jgi:hypothetical protein
MIDDFRQLLHPMSAITQSHHPPFHETDLLNPSFMQSQSRQGPPPPALSLKMNNLSQSSSSSGSRSHSDKSSGGNTEGLSKSQ